MFVHFIDPILSEKITYCLLKHAEVTFAESKYQIISDSAHYPKTPFMILTAADERYLDPPSKKLRLELGSPNSPSSESVSQLGLPDKASDISGDDHSEAIGVYIPDEAGRAVG